MSLFGKAALAAGAVGLVIVALARSRAASRNSAALSAAPMPTSQLAPPALTVPSGGVQQVVQNVQTGAQLLTFGANAAQTILANLPWSENDGSSMWTQ